jgi:uncharacterized membrane protein
MRLFLRLTLVSFFLVAGLAHLLMPGPYLAIMPPYVPWPREVVAVSGVAEIIGALGVCFSFTRRTAGWFLIGLLVAVFPANIQAISNGMVIGGYAVPLWALWARLPLQPLFIVWVFRACLGGSHAR